MEAEKLSLYLHIPFCVRKCLYCDFLSAPAGQDTIRPYVDALSREIRLTSQILGVPAVDTVFIGGGTPTVLETNLLEKLISELRDHFKIAPDAEISMECNPGTVDQDKLKAFRAAGINRLSIGVQSFQNEELRRLGRIHTAEEAVRCFEMARAAGFDNLNIDLMSAIPGQTISSWEENLQIALSLKPEHISAYSLIIEEDTPFEKMMREGLLPDVPDEDTDRAIYHNTGRILSGNGYYRYEISNYALSGCECRHNIGYWSGKEYLGLGIGAASMMDGHRFQVIRDLKSYLDLFSGSGENVSYEAILNDADSKEVVSKEAVSKEADLNVTDANKTDTSVTRSIWRLPQYEQVEELTENEKMSEFAFLGLRLTDGISRQAFEQRFHRSLDSVFEVPIREHIQNGLLTEAADRETGILVENSGIRNNDGIRNNYRIRYNDRIRLTERGLDLANYVMSDFLLDEE